jgi:glycosyltransferase involved in cell wall biosynthesis
MKHIVIDGRELRTTSGRYVERLLYYLQIVDKSHTYTVLLKPTDMGGWQPVSSLFKKVACPYKEFTFGEQLGLKKQIEGLKPDLVHFPFPQQPIRYNGPAITTIHDLTTLRFNNPDKNFLMFKFKQRVYRHVMKKVVRKSESVITGSHFVKEDIVRFGNITPDKITVTYEAADSIHEKPEPVLELDGQKFIMYIGRPTPHKNLERLIEAFRRIHPQQPDLLLVLAGKKDANYERLEKKVRHQAIPNIVFTDYVSEGQLRWLYENCEAYVFPSLSEGFGLPGLEAMLHGAPVLSSNATCLPEIYGDAAQYFDPLNVQSIANAINNVLINERLRLDLIHKGRLQVAKYSWQTMAEQTLAVYKQALGEII